MQATWLLALVLTGEATGTRSAEDDLALVKKAVARSSPAPTVVETPRATGRNGKEPRWFRLRVAEKRGTKVSINLPLALVRAMGEDWAPRPPLRPALRRGASLGQGPGPAHAR